MKMKHSLFLLSKLDAKIDKIDAKILINKLKQIGFTHDKAYQKSVDSTFLEG